MKRFNVVAVISLLVGVFLVSGIGYAVETSPEATKEVAKQLEMAKSCEAKASAQDALIAEHTEMRDNYFRKLPSNPRFAVPADVYKMRKHCNAIIDDATKLRNDLLEFAKWHRMRAAELEGK